MAKHIYVKLLQPDPVSHFNLSVLYVTWDPPQWDKARAEYSEAIKKGVKPDTNLEKLLEGGKVSQR